MQLFYSNDFVLPLPPEHRFPMEKYALLHKYVVAARFTGASIAEPHYATNDEILRAHDAAYLQQLMDGTLTPQAVRRIGFPWSPELVVRERHVAGATIDAARAALQNGCAINLAGGTHHAFRDHGAGYCVFNDNVIAARAVQAEHLADRIVILDCDVHQGDGTAAITASDDTIFTFSIHGAKNYPFHKQRSDLDVALDDGTADDAYLSALKQGVTTALDQARTDLAFYVAGADPFKGDRLGRLAVSQRGLAERDTLIYDACTTAGLPVVISMAGGYAHDVADTVAIHSATVRSAVERYGAR